MKLLILTQVVDKEDHFLGFFHKWIEEFSKNYENITVICLKKGKYDLPNNIKVLSLGKEEGKSRLKYIKNFYKYIWNERKNYDKVFVHMNQEYILMAGDFWKLFGKDIFMWRNHYSGSILTDVAVLFCKKVFCTSKYSYTAKYKKTEIMPVGVDMDLFINKPNIARKPRSILSFGRITPSKNIDILVEALDILNKKGVSFTADIYGDALPKDIEYLNGLKNKVKGFGLEDKVIFYAGVPHSMAPELYYSHEIFINPSKSGMYDKMIFEAMISECLLLSSNEDLKGSIDDDFIFRYGDPKQIADKLSSLLSYSAKQRSHASQIIKIFAEKHSLKKLVKQLFNIVN